MGIKLDRKKPKNFIASFVYRLQKILPFSTRTKFRFFLNMEWIMDRLSHEMSFKYYPRLDHPVRQFSIRFILEQINAQNVVLDLGCSLGDITFLVAEKAKEVVGIDYDKNAIDKAKLMYQRPNLSFYNREALEYLNENPAQFDTLILSHILEHLDDPKGFLMKFKGFFKQIYIELPDFDRHYLNRYRTDLKLKLVYTDDDHISEFDRDELKALLDDCNISILKAEYRYGIQKLWCRVSN